MILEDIITQLKKRESSSAKKALSYLDDLDTVIDVYFHPAGSIAIHGFKNRAVVYKVFKDL